MERKTQTDMNHPEKDRDIFTMERKTERYEPWRDRHREI